MHNNKYSRFENNQINVMLIALKKSNSGLFLYIANTPTISMKKSTSQIGCNFILTYRFEKIYLKIAATKKPWPN